MSHTVLDTDYTSDILSFDKIVIFYKYDIFDIHMMTHIKHNLTNIM